MVKRLLSGLPLLLSGAAGFALAWWRFGPGVLSPQSITWFRGDSSWHFLSWTFFRGEPWGLPPGRIERFLAPLGTSIGASDALPLLAFPFKLLSPLLPTDFQYLGLWLFLCYVLQGIFGYLLIQTVCGRRSLALLGSLLLLLSPIMLFRAGHIALSSHWLLLFALWHYFRTSRQPRFGFRRYAGIWLLIVVLAGLIHPYFTAMTLPLTLLSLIDEVRFKGRVSSAHALALFVGLLLLLGLEWWASGLFGLGKGGGFDLYTLNPNALINPLHYSRFLPALPVGPGQYEGFAYLGLGLLALVGVTLWTFLRSPKVGIHRVATFVTARERRPLLLLCLGLSLFSLGNTVIFILEVAALYGLLLSYFIRHPPSLLERFSSLPFARYHLVIFLVVLGAMMVAGIPLVTSTFRAPGRFVWPVVYLLELGLITLLYRRYRSAVVAALLLGALALQLADLKINQPFRAGRTTFHEHLQSEAWPRVVEPFRTIAVIPPFGASIAAPNDYLEFASLAARTGKYVTTGTLVRIPDDLAHVTETLNREALVGPRDPDTLYVFGAETFARTVKSRLKPGLS